MCDACSHACEWFWNVLLLEEISKRTKSNCQCAMKILRFSPIKGLSLLVGSIINGLVVCLISIFYLLAIQWEYYGPRQSVVQTLFSRNQNEVPYVEPNQLWDHNILMSHVLVNWIMITCSGMLTSSGHEIKGSVSCTRFIRFFTLFPLNGRTF